MEPKSHEVLCNAERLNMDMRFFARREREKCYAKGPSRVGSSGSVVSTSVSPAEVEVELSSGFLSLLVRFQVSVSSALEKPVSTGMGYSRKKLGYARYLGLQRSLLVGPCADSDVCSEL